MKSKIKFSALSAKLQTRIRKELAAVDFTEVDVQVLAENLNKFCIARVGVDPSLTVSNLTGYDQFFKGESLRTEVLNTVALFKDISIAAKFDTRFGSIQLYWFWEDFNEDSNRSQIAFLLIDRVTGRVREPK